MIKFEYNDIQNFNRIDVVLLGFKLNVADRSKPNSSQIDKDPLTFKHKDSQSLYCDTFVHCQI